MIEVTDFISFLSFAFSSLLIFLWKEDRAKMKDVYNHYMSSKDDHKEVKDIKDKSNNAYLEYALSNEKLASAIVILDKDFRHGLSNLTNVVNGFGSRLTAIEQDIEDRLKENNDIKKRLEVVEKILLKN